MLQNVAQDMAPLQAFVNTVVNFRAYWNSCVRITRTAYLDVSGQLHTPTKLPSGIV